MGLIYLNGCEKIDADEGKGIEYLKQSYEKGDKYSAYLLSMIYYEGKGEIKKDKKETLSWLKKGVKSYDTNCMRALGGAYLGYDSTYSDIKDIGKGIELLEKASKRGDGVACTVLGNEYSSGEHIGKDDQKALEYWEKATKLKDSGGAFNLGWAYITGTGCEKDVKKGIEIWKTAAENGDGAAANNLCCYYGNGQYGGGYAVINKELAKKYLLMAAENGDAMGCYNLALEYYRGNNLMSKNDAQAFAYMKLAADGGNADACAYLSDFYEKAIGCNKDPKKAKEYKDKAEGKK